MEDAWVHDTATVLGKLRVSPDKGLSDRQVAELQQEHGRNELPPPEPTPFYKLVLKQFEDLLVLILLGAAIVSFLLACMESGEDRLTAFVEPAVILCILIANATVGVIQETNAEASIEALRKSEARHAVVIRNGENMTVPSAELVPGDIIVVDVGDKVPADARVLQISTATLSVDEAILTGENLPASKTTEPIKNPNAVTADRRNLLFSGTLVVRGKALGVVVQTGVRTAMGQIAHSLSEEEEEKTPLQEKLDEFGEQLSKVIGVICIVVWLINIGHFTDPEHGSFLRGAIYYFKIAVALAVAAIPEGLPAVVTTCLALGTMKMAKKNAIVRSLPSVETLGCTTVICSDKTGTLTTNKMSVQHVVAVEAVQGRDAILRDFAVEGDSFAPYGVVRDYKTKRELELPACQHPGLAEIAKICVLNNESELQYVPPEDKHEVGTYSKSGTPTEAALKVLAEKIGVPDEKLCDAIFRNKDPRIRVSAVNKFWRDRFDRAQILEFSRDRKSMSVIVRDLASKRHILFCKGAPEHVVERCIAIRAADGSVHKLTPSMKDDLSRRYIDMAKQGLRCLALASLDNPNMNADFTDLENFAAIESGMTLVGLVGMLDPPRKAVPQSIQTCQEAGIRVIVITGDHPVTAESICRRIGLLGADEDASDKSFTGEQFSAMSVERQKEVLQTAVLFSRVEPKHKHKMVTILKELNEVVAMTGDGVNDAPALNAAHIGIAMGSGTDVAREASDMVLQDDNFATIVMAIEEGRAIYANTKQFIRYLISSNIGEVACIFMTAAIGMPEALIPVQLLWVNLVTDGLPATALGFNPPDRDIMRRSPRDRTEGIINGWMFFRYMAIGIYVGVGTVLGFIWWYLSYEDGPRITYAQLTNFHACGRDTNLFPAGFNCDMFHDPRPSTISLSVLVTIEMFNALNALSENQSLFVTPPWVNKWVDLAILLSFTLHFAIVYIPFFSAIFHVAPLNTAEWTAVFAFSFPVFILDEILKFISRNVQARSGRVAPSKKHPKTA